MITVRNVYHMLAYAYSQLNEAGYRNMATEQFEGVRDLCAAILERAVSNQVRRGLRRGYLERTGELAGLRGKVEMAESMRSQALLRRRLVCAYDEFALDTPMNRVVKSTLSLLARSPLPRKRRGALRSLAACFDGVQTVDLRRVNWNFAYDRNNATYRIIVAMCRLVAKGLLQTTEDGSVRMRDYLDEQAMYHLYERFILEYYRKERPDLDPRASEVPWALDDGGDTGMLPRMESDITLSKDGRVLIIDAKYYRHPLQDRYGKATVRSGHLYQIFAYVKNRAASLVAQGTPGDVSGMLLYAAPDEGEWPSGSWRMSGNRIEARTLDLNRPFSEIRAELDGIAEEFFPTGGEGWSGLLRPTLAASDGLPSQNKAGSR